MLWRIQVSRNERSQPPSVAMGYVIESVQSLLKLRSDQFGQSVVVQQIPLDAIVEHAYDPTRSVGSKFQGRIITL